MFTAKDQVQIRKRGILPVTIEQQIDCFRKGFPYINLHDAATIGNGILRLGAEEIHACIANFERYKKSKKIVKFVPASGAATRMFKDLLSFLADETKYSLANKDQLERKHPEVLKFIGNLYRFPFIDDLEKITARYGQDLQDLIQSEDYRRIVTLVVGQEGLNYGQLPKGVLKFHSYQEHQRTALEEHLVEGAEYAIDDKKEVNLHVTVSEQFRELFEEHIASVKACYEEKFGVGYTVDFSVQNPSTDTIAVDMDNNPFREPNGSLHFRPGGHGALLKNLNDLDADIIFIKNIDNVTIDQQKTYTYTYKKALGGLLLSLQERIFRFLKTLSAKPKQADYQEIRDFISKELRHDPGQDSIFDFLNRPLRICGMVKNEGEPGGGPYWVNEPSGRKTLQIVEMSQVNTSDHGQVQIINQSTHFNPVDLVCGCKDYKGNKFDLFRLVNPETGFISKKSYDGRPLKALELPGLWNGAMAGWITIFVELPIETFTPVKTVNDLLRAEHQ
jgi:hypothetical protein